MTKNPDFLRSLQNEDGVEYSWDYKLFVLFVSKAVL